VPSAHVDRLATYHQKRDFDVTSEPHGGDVAHTTGDRFVIQCHAARRRHYDFRLELDGVLLSWSVPKGPCLDPQERRLAVRTEDHPLDYADFECIIPPKQYGAGGVIVWDRGRWKPHGDARAMLKKGHLTFDLLGEKLRGRWHLVRTRGGERDKENWLLFKGKDEHADPKRDIVAEAPASVVSGRTVEQVTEAPERVWHSNRSAGGEINQLLQGLPLGFQLTNLDKVLYPEQGITKAQLVAYLAVVTDWMMPQLANRPLTLVRCPEGRHKPCFFQKKIFPGSPKAIQTVDIEEEDGATVEYMRVNDMPGLVGLAQLGTLEIHTWGCHADKVERPDLMVFDLDPDVGMTWEHVALAAFDVRRRLGELGFTSFVKTTGGKGLHVCAPIKRTIDWDSFKAFTKAFADQMAEDEPKKYTANISKAARKGRIFVDYLRNGRNATFITPFSPRARPNAPVAVPITWEELAHGVDPAAFTTKTVPQRLAGLKKDPWHGIDDVDQAITAAAWRALGAKPPKVTKG
jgi:bifunctional non-homologous end joining protein LigD